MSLACLFSFFSLVVIVVASQQKHRFNPLDITIQKAESAKWYPWWLTESYKRFTVPMENFMLLNALLTSLHLCSVVHFTAVNYLLSYIYKRKFFLRTQSSPPCYGFTLSPFFMKRLTSSYLLIVYYHSINNFFFNKKLLPPEWIAEKGRDRFPAI
jgi:hypothetical protein